MFLTAVLVIFLGNNWCATILWTGSSLTCVQYNIRTFLPRQPEITCAAPTNLSGVRIKELMIKKANDTLNTSMQQAGIGTSLQERNNFLANLMPALGAMGLSGGVNAAGGGNAPILNSLSQAIPSLKSIPGWAELCLVQILEIRRLRTWNQPLNRFESLYLVLLNFVRLPSHLFVCLQALSRLCPMSVR